MQRYLEWIQVSLHKRSEEMTIEVGVLIAIASALIGYMSYSLNRSKEIKSDGRQGQKQTRNWSTSVKELMIFALI